MGYPGDSKKTEPEKILLEIERYVTSSVPADFYLETMEVISELMNRRYLSSCEGCKHKIDGVYQFECLECRRYFGDLKEE